MISDAIDGITAVLCCRSLYTGLAIQRVCDTGFSTTLLSSGLNPLACDDDDDGTTLLLQLLAICTDDDINVIHHHHHHHVDLP